MINVGEAESSDIQEISEFLATAWAEAGPGAPGFTGATDADIAVIRQPEVIRQRMGGPDRRMFLARQEGKVVGFAATRRIDERSVELAGIIVLEQVAGRGIGTKLVDAALGACRAQGAQHVLVHTETDNHRAQEFYKAIGFEPTRVLVARVDGTPVEVVELIIPLIAAPRDPRQPQR